MRVLVLPTVILAIAAFSNAQAGFDSEEGELTAGLVARYSAGDVSVARIDPDVQFVWRHEMPDRRLPVGPFSVQWTGQILARAESTYRFHLYLEGNGTVTLDGREILRGERSQAGWVVSDEVPLEGGEHPIEIHFAGPAPGGTVRLFWASEAFPLEPVSAPLLFHEGGDAGASQIERGEELFSSLRCGACHQRANDLPLLNAMSLRQAAVGLSADWLVQWLQNPARSRPHARMPAFGFSTDEAHSIAGFLRSQSATLTEAVPTVIDRAAAARRGELLFRSTGCLACHTTGDLGVDSPFSGGDLTDVGKRRSEAWLWGWLKEPARLNRAHRMPVFALSDDERRDLTTYLAGTSQPERASAPAKEGEERIRAGRVLVEQARCNACHRDEDTQKPSEKISRLDHPVADWSRACSESESDRKAFRPGYSLPEADRLALRAAIASQPKSPEGPWQASLRWMKWNNCRNCHERDGGTGLASVAGKVARIDPDLAGQSEALMPPDLTAVGDKLADSFLATAVLGRQETRRLPWLRLRMPQFPAPPTGIPGLDRWLIDHDRIPETETTSTRSPAPAELRPVGRVLAGARGFSCVGCHKVGRFEPRNVALATRGSDLFALEKRMRPELFRRWVRSPLRVIPNMEMPSFDKANPELLGGNHDLQLAALWAALNDPEGPPTLDTSLIEQFLVVEKDGPVRIVRDVFHVGELTRPQSVPRAFAVGFGNQANLLFDLDRMALRAWWVGDFARQRSAGKSWNWELGAAPISLTNGETPDLALVANEDSLDKPIFSRIKTGRFGKLHGYRQEGAGIVIDYRLEFDVGTDRAALEVHESFAPASSDDVGEAVWVRETAIHGIPKGYHPVMRRSNEVDRFVPLAVDQNGRAEETRRYSEQATASGAAPPLGKGNPKSRIERLTVVPGYDGARLPLPWSIMPTSLTWNHEGILCFTSLKGHVYQARDTDGDGIEDSLVIFEEGLASPYGLIADGRDLLVAHKPELLRLRDEDSDGRAERREVVADGWGYTDDYHDWTTGIVRDTKGNLYVGTGSDYARKGRSREQGKWRGKLLRIDRNGTTVPLGHALRYPTGLAINADDQVFVSDNQGVQNTFNEINHLVEGGRYGVPSLFEEPFGGSPLPPAIQVPHPWTRSVNGIFFLPAKSSDVDDPFAGHGIGCEYDGRFLVRFTLQRVDATYQGAVYPFSRPPEKQSVGQLLGTLCGAVAPNGDLYIGSFLDSGWLGGPNVGDIVRLRRNGPLPCGIREIKAFGGEFVITFTATVNREAAGIPENYDISGYTRVWQGAYATPDSGRHKLAVRFATVANDGKSVILRTDRQKAGHVYEVNCGRLASATGESLWPDVGHYTMNQIPER